MENTELWIVCKRKSKVHLLARDEQAYYIIEVGRHLDYATEEWLCQQGVSEALVKELKLTYQRLSVKELRGVAIGGELAGDMICLYPKSGKRLDFTLELDYEDAFVEDFFRSIPRFAPPKKPGDKKLDWRAQKQDPVLFERLKYVPPLCMVVAASAACGYVRTSHWIGFTLCLICMAVQIGLAVCMPVYFTITLPKGAKKHKVWELELPLLVPMCILIFRSRVNLLEDSAFWVTLLIGAAAGFVLYQYLPDMKEEKWGLLCTMMVSAFAGMLLIGQCNQVYDFKVKDNYVLQVEDLHTSSHRRGRTYYCHVTLPDGRTVSLDISGDLYKSLEVGDWIRVERGEGAFGMEYANAHPLD